MINLLKTMQHIGQLKFAVYWNTKKDCTKFNFEFEQVLLEQSWRYLRVKSSKYSF